MIENQEGWLTVRYRGKDKQLQLTGTTGAFVGTCTWESRERADQYLYIFTKSLGSVSVWMPSVGFLPNTNSPSVG